ncbi:helix-turn-helix domain-containing protein [Saccharopolyspora rectivirgula]|nr:helix-turn-helix transcriptional regulator [Saccharopolyspora rectivirgula]
MTSGADLRAAREGAGLSLAQMARRTHFTRSYLSMIETGKRPVSDEVVAVYERVLGVPLSAPGDPVRVAHEWLLADSPAAVHTRAGRQIGTSLVEELGRRAVELRRLDDVVSSSVLLPVVAAELRRAEELVRDARFSEPVGRQLCAVLGELAQLAGWVAGDTGRLAEAQRYYLRGVEAAQAAGDRVLGAQLISTLSYQLANTGKVEDAVLLARTAVRGADGATPVVRALLLERVAWACAKAGDAGGALRALDAVDDAYADRGVAEPEWVYWLDRNEIDVMAGRCLVELGRPGEAIPLLSRALENYPEERSREVALYLTWLAESCARLGELDAAEEILERAGEHAARMPSARVDVRLEELRKLL